METKIEPKSPGIATSEERDELTRKISDLELQLQESKIRLRFFGGIYNGVLLEECGGNPICTCRAPGIGKGDRCIVWVEPKLRDGGNPIDVADWGVDIWGDINNGQQHKDYQGRLKKPKALKGFHLTIDFRIAKDAAQKNGWRFQPRSGVVGPIVIGTPAQNDPIPPPNEFTFSLSSFHGRDNCQLTVCDMNTQKGEYAYDIFLVNPDNPSWPAINKDPIISNDGL